MITLYHCMSARSFRPLWMLEELGLPYDLIVLPFPPRASVRSYLDINPLGTIPLMINGRTRMTESAAICQYLCALSAPTPLQVEPEEEASHLYLRKTRLTISRSLARTLSRSELVHRQVLAQVLGQLVGDLLEGFVGQRPDR